MENRPSQAREAGATNAVSIESLLFKSIKDGPAGYVIRMREAHGTWIENGVLRGCICGEVGCSAYIWLAHIDNLKAAIDQIQAQFQRETLANSTLRAADAALRAENEALKEDARFIATDFGYCRKERDALRAERDALKKRIAEMEDAPKEISDAEYSALLAKQARERSEHDAKVREPLEKRIAELIAIGRHLSEIFHHEHRSVTILDMDALDKALGITHDEVSTKYPALWEAHDERVRREALGMCLKTLREQGFNITPEIEQQWWDFIFTADRSKPDAPSEASQRPHAGLEGGMSGWVDCAKQLPMCDLSKDSFGVEVRIKPAVNGEETAFFGMRHTPNRKPTFYKYGNWQDYTGVTHWMPLPKPPAAGEEG